MDLEFLYTKEMYDIQNQKNHTVFYYKKGVFRGLIGVPFRADKHVWYKFFIKSDKDSFDNPTEKSDLPDWFLPLIERTEVFVEKRDRIRKLYVKRP